MAGTDHADGLRHETIGFGAWRAVPGVMPLAHTHTDIELNFLLGGGARYFLAGRFHELAPGRLAVFWAGMPHRLVRVLPATEYLCVTLPLAWFLPWQLADGFARQLMEGALLREPGGDVGTDDERLLRRWADDLGRPGAQGPRAAASPEARKIVLLEVEARLRRLALALSASPAGGGIPASATPSDRSAEGGQVEQIARFLSRHYRDPLSLEQIGRAVELHPNYAMRVFKQGCGMSIWEYLLRLRVSHAQRLLLTTDWTVLRVAVESGFGSPGRFHETFRRVCGQSPRQYRRGAAPA
jgi:AraC-like DNA-binding protein